MFNLFWIPYWLSASTVGVLSLIAMGSYGHELLNANSPAALTWFSIFTTITSIQIPIHLLVILPARLSLVFMGKLMGVPCIEEQLNPEAFYSLTLTRCNYALAVFITINLFMLFFVIRPLINDKKLNEQFFSLFFWATFIHLAVLLLRFLAMKLGKTTEWFRLAW